ncbi:unnamed protein product [Lampetra planeri]
MRTCPRDVIAVETERWDCFVCGSEMDGSSTGRWSINTMPPRISDHNGADTSAKDVAPAIIGIHLDPRHPKGTV